MCIRHSPAWIPDSRSTKKFLDPGFFTKIGFWIPPPGFQSNYKSGLQITLQGSTFLNIVIWVLKLFTTIYQTEYYMEYFIFVKIKSLLITSKICSCDVNVLIIRIFLVFPDSRPMQYDSSFHQGLPKSLSQSVLGHFGGM